MQTKERIVWIDQLRAVAFIFVILGHMTINKTVESWIYSFHMPLFFLISGLTLNIEKVYNTSFKKYFTNLFRRMIIPYFWIQFICLLAICVINAVTNGKAVPVAGNIKGIFVANGLILPYPSRAMYFVIVLFFAQLCLWFFIRMTKMNYVKLSVVCILFSTISILLENKDMVWRINVVPAAVLLIFIGRLLMDLYLKYKDKLESLSLIKYGIMCTALFIIGIVYWKYNGRLSMAGNEYGKSFTVAIVCSIFTSIAIALVVMKLPKVSVLITAGKNTLFYMGMHKLFITLFERWFSEWKGSLPFVIILCAGIFLLLIPVVKFCEKCCPYLLGRPTGEDNAFIIFGKILCIASCVFAPYFFVADKFFDLTATLNFVLASVAYIVICGACFVILQKIPFVYIQKRK